MNDFDKKHIIDTCLRSIFHFSVLLFIYVEFSTLEMCMCYLHAQSSERATHSFQQGASKTKRAITMRRSWLQRIQSGQTIFLLKECMGAPSCSTGLAAYF